MEAKLFDLSLSGFFEILAHLRQMFHLRILLRNSKMRMFFFSCSDKSYVESVVSFLHDVVPQVRRMPSFDHENLAL